MKITMIAVCSANGKLTRGEEANFYEWTSNEDASFFASEVRKSELVVLGSGTYNAGLEKVSLENGRLRVVMTGNPAKYAARQVPGRLEFSDAKPAALVEQLEKRGYPEMLLIGGAEIFSSFMQAGLVDEVALTLEPVLFGEGKSLFAESGFAARLELRSVKKLNRRGTLLLRYEVEK
jgi:dihydrofolate reductase